MVPVEKVLDIYDTVIMDFLVAPGRTRASWTTRRISTNSSPTSTVLGWA